MEIDHLQVLNKPEAFTEAADHYRRVASLPGGVTHASVLHENNNSCCQREEWSTTYRRILAEVRKDIGGNILVTGVDS